MPFELLATTLDGPLILAPKCSATTAVSSWRPTDEATSTPWGSPRRWSRATTPARRVASYADALHGGQRTAKLVRCARGEIYDVLVDLRRGSPTYGEWEGFELTEETMHTLYAPPGFGHGFCVAASIADVTYMLDAYYDAETEHEITHRDPAIGIDWPVPESELQVSQRDIDAPLLADIADQLPFVY